MPNTIQESPITLAEAMRAGAVFGFVSHSLDRAEFESRLVTRLQVLEDLFGAMGAIAMETLDAFDQAAWQAWEQYRGGALRPGPGSRHAIEALGHPTSIRNA